MPSLIRSRSDLDFTPYGSRDSRKEIRYAGQSCKTFDAIRRGAIGRALEKPGMVL